MITTEISLTNKYFKHSLSVYLKSTFLIIYKFTNEKFKTHIFIYVLYIRIYMCVCVSAV